MLTSRDCTNVGSGMADALIRDDVKDEIVGFSHCENVDVSIISQPLHRLLSMSRLMLDECPDIGLIRSLILTIL